MIFHKEIQINFMQTASELIIEMECTFLLYCENIIEMYVYISSMYKPYKQSMCLNFYTTTMKILPLYLVPTRKRIKKLNLF